MRITDSGPGYVSYPYTQVFSCCSLLVSRPRGSLSVSKVIMLSCLISHWRPVGSVGQLQLLSLLRVFYSSLGCWEINVWEGKHTKGSVREAGLKLMESGFFERKQFTNTAMKGSPCSPQREKPHTQQPTPSAAINKLILKKEVQIK